MQNKHGRSDGPTKEDFALTANTFVGKDAMCTFLNPINNILATTWPKEAHPNSEQCFVDTKVTTNGAAMKDFKD
jgi:hypothetical protein